MTPEQLAKLTPEQLSNQIQAARTPEERRPFDQELIRRRGLSDSYVGAGSAEKGEIPDPNDTSIIHNPDKVEKLKVPDQPEIELITPDPGVEINDKPGKQKAPDTEVEINDEPREPVPAPTGLETVNAATRLMRVHPQLAGELLDFYGEDGMVEAHNPQEHGHLFTPEQLKSLRTDNPDLFSDEQLNAMGTGPQNEELPS